MADSKDKNINISHSTQQNTSDKEDISTSGNTYTNTDCIINFSNEPFKCKHSKKSHISKKQSKTNRLSDYTNDVEVSSRVIFDDEFVQYYNRNYNRFEEFVNGSICFSCKMAKKFMWKYNGLDVKLCSSCFLRMKRNHMLCKNCLEVVYLSKYRIKCNECLIEIALIYKDGQI